MLKRIVDWIALTNTERKAILFLIITLLVGAGIRLFQTKSPSVPRLDYHVSDRNLCRTERSDRKIV